MTIPKIIHQIWLQGYSQLPTELQSYHENCKRIHNDFKHYFWDEESIVELLKKYYGAEYLDLYHSYQVFAQKADFARYAILYLHGGIYLDMDMKCHKNLSYFLNHDIFFSSSIYPDLFKKYLNGIIGAVPQHPIFFVIFDNIFKRANKKNEVSYSTGTNLFYDSIKEYQKNHPNDDIYIADQKYLNPCHMFHSKKCQDQCKDCYIVHTNYSSWSPTNRCLVKVFQYKYWILIITILLIMILFFFH